MKVAFATRDGQHVTEQFRRAPRLVVYEVTAAGARLDRTVSFPTTAGARTDERIRAIAGATLVYVSAIGPSTAARLASSGIRAATAGATTRIHELLVALRERLHPEFAAGEGGAEG